MARTVLAEGALDDLERILSHLVESGVGDAGKRVADIASAIDVLARHPLIGRPAPPALREVVIGRGTRGYRALYRFEELDDIVVVLALRGQREAGHAAHR